MHSSYSNHSHCGNFRFAVQSTAISYLSIHLTTGVIGVHSTDATQEGANQLHTLRVHPEYYPTNYTDINFYVTILKCVPVINTISHMTASLGQPITQTVTQTFLNSSYSTNSFCGNWRFSVSSTPISYLSVHNTSGVITVHSTDYT